MSVPLSVRVHARACTCVCVRVRAREYMFADVCVRGGGGMGVCGCLQRGLMATKSGSLSTSKTLRVVCVFVCVWLCVCVCVHVCVCTHTLSVYMCVYTHTHTIYMCVCVYPHTHYICVYAHTHSHTHTLYRLAAALGTALKHHSELPLESDVSTGRWHNMHALASALLGASQVLFLSHTNIFVAIFFVSVFVRDWNQDKIYIYIYIYYIYINIYL